MATTTKKALTNKIAEKLDLKQTLVRQVVQAFLDGCVEELRKGNRLEFRDFGVFETVSRAARKARNPKTGEVVQVPPKIVVDFKMGKRMKTLVNQAPRREQEEAPAQSQAPTPPLPEQPQPSAADQPGPVQSTRPTSPQESDEPSAGPAAPPWSASPPESE